MKKWLFLTLLMLLPMSVSASEVQPQKMYLTCYLPTGNQTATGCYPYYGIAATRREDVGKVASLYMVNDDGSLGEWIGYFEIRDIGGTEGLKNGKVVDVFLPSETIMKSWVERFGTKAYVYFYEGKG